MILDSITGDVAAYKMQSTNAAVPLVKSTKGTPATNDRSANRTAITINVDASDNHKASAAIKQSLVADINREVDKKPVRTMSHVVEVYNVYGKVRTKFMDSNNKVIYQIPSEMIAKMEDLMMKPEISASING